ncbi:hypothetical protein HJC10_09015 [Corallococcus exiguus]|uniref:hypothetical protein n=1 Tax=Corallococcus TaxID=83461 RepID=UPI000EDC799C|nr:MULTISPECIES: hypothetical protein [Corallococcus]NNB94660.1 hypothetical protein [Corallococcus exiguus]NNC02991.1 hypothetical protein [Corallococcus exiguus]NPC47486.1 hypothetical protein [Corallococcus exiguus]RKH83076.1 hypothetical protein D7X99_13700 [Corallococcus sp. AB032C]
MDETSVYKQARAIADEVLHDLPHVGVDVDTRMCPSTSSTQTRRKHGFAPEWNGSETTRITLLVTGERDFEETVSVGA